MASLCKILFFIGLIFLFFSVSQANDATLYSTGKLIKDLKDPKVTVENKVRRIRYACTKSEHIPISNQEMFCLVDIMLENQGSPICSNIADFIKTSKYSLSKEDTLKLVEYVKPGLRDATLISTLSSVISNADLKYETDSEILKKLESAALSVPESYEGNSDMFPVVYFFYINAWEKLHEKVMVLENKMARHFVLDRKYYDIINMSFISSDQIFYTFDVDAKGNICNFRMDAAAVGKISEMIIHAPIVVKQRLFLDKSYIAFFNEEAVNSTISIYLDQNTETTTRKAAQNALLMIFPACKNIDEFYSLAKNAKFDQIEQIGKAISLPQEKSSTYSLPLRILSNRVYFDSENGKYFKLLDSILKDEKVGVYQKDLLLLEVMNNGINHDNAVIEKYVETNLPDIGSNLYAWKSGYFKVKHKLSVGLMERFTVKLGLALLDEIKKHPNNPSLLMDLAYLGTHPKFTAQSLLRFLKQDEKQMLSVLKGIDLITTEDENDKECINSVVKAYHDSLLKSLQHILGKDFGDDYEAWQKAIDAMPDDKTLEEEEK